MIEHAVSEAIKSRLDAGQKFNAYNLIEGYSVSLGPISGRLQLAETTTADAANLIVAALRHAFDQPVVLSPVEVEHDEFCSFDMDGVSACDCGAV